MPAPAGRRPRRADARARRHPLAVARRGARLRIRIATRRPPALVHDDGESLLVRQAHRGSRSRAAAGHTDTVPAQANLPGRIEDGAVHGLGASDMKGGLAVMIELARWAAHAELAYDLGLLFFPREEVGPAENPLPARVRGRAARRRGGARRSASSRPTTRSSSAASATSSPASCSRAARRTRRGRGSA